MTQKLAPLLIVSLVVSGLVACVSTANLDSHAQPKQYFPTGSLDNDPQLDRLQRGWYGSMLAAMNEPVLSPTDKPSSYFALRILFLPTWGPPVAIRYEGNVSHGAYRAVELSGRGGYSPGKVSVSKTGALNKQDLTNIRSALANAGYWLLPQKDDVMGMDGSELVIETLKGGKYRVFIRWTPSANAHSRELEKLVKFYTSQFERFGLWPAQRPN